MMHELIFTLKRHLCTNFDCDIAGSRTLLPTVPHIERNRLILFINLSENYSQIIKIMGLMTGGKGDIFKSHLYLEALREGIQLMLDDYDKHSSAIEKELLEDTSVSILTILNRMNIFHLPLEAVNQSLKQLKENNLHGCQIVELCYKFIRSGVPDVKSTFTRILKPCRIVLLRQIRSWIFYGKLNDPFKEFFIKKVVQDEDKTMNKTFCGSVSPSSNTSRVTSSFNEEEYTQLYYLDLDYVPSIIRLSVANKILFIGETVLLFLKNPKEQNKDPVPVIDISKYGIDQVSLAYKFSELEDMMELDIGIFETLINDVWLSVNKYLWRLAEEVGCLSSQFKFISEIYLLGRGELFQEFLYRANVFLDAPAKCTRSKSLDYALESAAYYVYLSENFDILNRIYFVIPHKDSYQQTSKTRNVFQLRYRTPWPLHLIFTSEVISSYNVIFKFLLHLKKANMDLTSVWIEISKIKDSEAQKVIISVHNQLLCLLKNLENYLYIDVIQGELEELENITKNSDKFIDIQRAHNIFLKNIINKAFLQSQEVHLPILDLLSICEEFSKVIKVEENLQVIVKFMGEMKKNITSVIENLIRVSLHFGTNHAQVYNLIIRLDYNCFFRDRFTEKQKIMKY